MQKIYNIFIFNLLEIFKHLKKVVIKGGLVISDGISREADILIKGSRIEYIGSDIPVHNARVIDAEGLWVIPGIIDDQVHFRDPGMPHKADIRTESIAAAVGGVTSFMDMPNTSPPTLTQELLEDKYFLGRKKSVINYSFFMGVSNDNVEEVLRTNPKNVCGVKIFMGSSTGNMLVDDKKTLEKIFSETPMLIATHCEDEATIKENLAKYIAKYGENIPFEFHPSIRDEKACYLSSSMAVEMAKKYGTRLHVLHISTAEELELFDNSVPLKDKRITAEVCVHHLYFDQSDYAELGAKIKCNPAIKAPRHKEALFGALLDDRLDIVATDHAPHTVKEKNQNYLQAPSGLPLVQHSLNVMLEFYQNGKITKERLVEKMCHAPADCFKIKDRGYLREGYYADIAIIDPRIEWQVQKINIRYKCRWSPFDRHLFRGKVRYTLVNGDLVIDNGILQTMHSGGRLEFER